MSHKKAISSCLNNSVGAACVGGLACHKSGGREKFDLPEIFIRDLGEFDLPTQALIPLSK